MKCLFERAQVIGESVDGIAVGTFYDVVAKRTEKLCEKDKNHPEYFVAVSHPLIEQAIYEHPDPESSCEQAKRIDTEKGWHGYFPLSAPYKRPSHMSC